jgi:hypothetical protein
MLVDATNRQTSGDLLRHVLLDYLQASRMIGWPGCDGLTQDDILNCYPRASAAGDVPDWHELCRRHPEWIAEITSLFARKGWLRN